MAKRFNTAGLCFPEDHYMVDPLKRLEDVDKLIEDKLYFTLHAPRQTGKTTYLHALARKLNSEKKYIALVVSFEQAGYEDLGTCDIEINNQERRKVVKVLKGFGFRIQKSVFECAMNRSGREELIRKLEAINVKTGFIKIYRLEYSWKDCTIGEQKKENPDEDYAFIV